VGNILIKIYAAMLLCLLFTLPCHSAPLKQTTGTCSGRLGKNDHSIFLVGRADEGCEIAISEEEKVFKSCVIGERCRVTGAFETCDYVGECSKVSRVFSARRLPEH
jgi:hypothetical protein